MKIKIVSALITVLISLSMCGCGLYKETDMQYTVSALGFDGINGITVYAEIITMNPQSDDITTGSCVLKASGENVISAFKELRHLVAKPLFLSHCGVICLGENLKKSQINDILDYCYDNDEINHTVYFINSSHTEELLNLKPESEISTGYNIMGIIRQSENSDCIHYNNIFYEIEAERTGAQDIFSVPEFEIENDTPVIKGVCVYSDCKRSAKLNLDESYYYYLLKGLSKSGNCVIGDKKVKISVPKTTFKCKADKNLKFD
ncbi:MAG: hypothetical protein II802_01685, partial [Clostridia bacterium]|nr:hypothetical protein [Clostridia bacterium]